MTTTLPWTQQYTPQQLHKVVGNAESVAQMKHLISRKIPTLLYGPIGCGKTCSVLSLANDLNYELIEVNASDVRNKDHINQIIGHALQQQSLFHQGKLILIDEVDGIAGNKDRGGLQALIKLLEDNNHAIIFTANDPWSSKFSTLRKKTKLVEFKAISTTDISTILKHICEQENITAEEPTLKTLARRSGGDIRAAINDLQQIAEGKESITEDDLLVLGDREREETIHNALRLIFKSKQTQDVLHAFDNVDLSLDESFLWLDENLPKEYAQKDLAKAYEALSKADVFKGRIRRWQHWRFLVYMNTLMTAGVALAKEEKTPGFVQYKRTSRLLKIWMANQKKAKKKALAEKIGDELHGSTRRIMQDIIPYLRLMLQYDKEQTFGLDKDEVAWLLK